MVMSHNSFDPACPPFTIGTLSGAITLARQLDYEIQRTHYCIIRAQDNGEPQLSSSTCLIVTVLDFNDNSPVFSPQNDTVALKESANVGQLVAYVFATDQDSGTNGQVFYNIVGGNNDGKFIIDSNGRITLADPLDYETEQQYILEVQARDSNSSPRLSTSNAFVTVNVEEVNDNRPIIQNFYRIEISEETVENTNILTLQASDNDRGPLTNEIVFIALENTTDFTISASGNISVAASLDYERQREYTLVAVVRGPGYPIPRSTCFCGYHNYKCQ